MEHQGNLIIKPNANDIEVFGVQNASGTKLLTVDGTNGGVGITADLTLTGALAANGRNLTRASGFWAGAPTLADPDPSTAFFYFEDFIGNVNFPTATGVAGGWKSVGDATYDVTHTAGNLGGIVQVAPEAGSNNEVYLQLGQLGTETYIEYTQNSGKKSWVEFRAAMSSITNAANIFLGLAEEGAAAANFISDGGDDFADKDLVGFVVWEGDPDAIDCTHQKAGGAFADPGLAGVPVATTFFTLGLYFDGVKTLTYYYNGTRCYPVFYCISFSRNWQAFRASELIYGRSPLLRHSTINGPCLKPP